MLVRQGLRLSTVARSSRKCNESFILVWLRSFISLMQGILSLVRLLAQKLFLILEFTPSNANCFSAIAFTTFSTPVSRGNTLVGLIKRLLQLVEDTRWAFVNSSDAFRAISDMDTTMSCVFIHRFEGPCVTFPPILEP